MTSIEAPKAFSLAQIVKGSDLIAMAVGARPEVVRKPSKKNVPSTVFWRYELREFLKVSEVAKKVLPPVNSVIEIPAGYENLKPIDGAVLVSAPALYWNYYDRADKNPDTLPRQGLPPNAGKRVILFLKYHPQYLNYLTADTGEMDDQGQPKIHYESGFLFYAWGSQESETNLEKIKKLIKNP